MQHATSDSVKIHNVEWVVSIECTRVKPIDQDHQSSSFPNEVIPSAVGQSVWAEHSELGQPPAMAVDGVNVKL